MKGPVILSFLGAPALTAQDDNGQFTFTPRSVFFISMWDSSAAGLYTLHRVANDALLGINPIHSLWGSQMYGAQCVTNFWYMPNK